MGKNKFIKIISLVLTVLLLCSCGNAKTIVPETTSPLLNTKENTAIAPYKDQEQRSEEYTTEEYITTNEATTKKADESSTRKTTTKINRETQKETIKNKNEKVTVVKPSTNVSHIIDKATTIHKPTEDKTTASNNERETTKKPTKPVTEPSTKPVTEPSTKPVAEPSTKLVTEPSTKPVTEPSTKPVTEPSTKLVTVPSTRHTTESITKPIPKNICYLTIDCRNIKKNIKDLTYGKARFVPINGYILKRTPVELRGGETVFDVLKIACKENSCTDNCKYCKKNGIHLEFTFTTMYNNYYIEGIHQLYEFDCGTNSGWMYKVNGVFPHVSSSSYPVSVGDEIHFVYTCNGGEDVGDRIR